MDQASLEVLLERYQAGDPLAFQAFYVQTKGIVFNFLLSRLGHRMDAEEAFQETYFRIHRYILTYRRDAGESGMSWVFTIARNVLIDTVKKRKPTVV